jgi:hypothetical protein
MVYCDVFSSAYRADESSVEWLAVDNPYVVVRGGVTKKFSFQEQAVEGIIQGFGEEDDQEVMRRTKRKLTRKTTRS